jgi:hypothetical protein
MGSNGEAKGMDANETRIVLLAAGLGMLLTPKERGR